tara:strand:+ start:60 stop:896 length:837 start_codon:yes stop_codon:yes gene_type:complete
MSKLLKYSTNSPSSPSTKSLFVSVRVVDIILNIDHPKASLYGGVDSIGTIFYGDIESKKGIDNPENLPTAKPIFTHQKYLPLINEIVLLINININKDNKSKQKLNLYFPNINIWNSPHHNAMPLTEYYQNGNNEYSNTQEGFVKSPQDNQLNIPLGETFIEKDFIKPLRPFEGDNILEGRLGNSIRLGSTSKPLNPWSQNGENSDPIIIIRNGQYNDINDETFNPNIEDINNDDSSIYLTSNQNINDFKVASKNMQSYNKGELPYKSPEDNLTNPPLI